MTKIRVTTGCNLTIQRNTSSRGHVVIQEVDWYPSMGLFPDHGSTTYAIYLGYQFKALDDGTVQGISFSQGQIITAWTNSPGQIAANWGY